MTFKKIGSLLLGALMVVGLSSAVSAQSILQDGDGVRLRVTNPDNGGFAGIGDTVKVEVHYLTTIVPTNIRVAIVTDTLRHRSHPRKFSGARPVQMTFRDDRGLLDNGRILTSGHFRDW